MARSEPGNCAHGSRSEPPPGASSALFVSEETGTMPGRWQSKVEVGRAEEEKKVDEEGKEGEKREDKRERCCKDF